MSKKQDKCAIVLNGYVLPSDYNRHGKTTEIAIETEDFKQYIVCNNMKGIQLSKSLYHEVSVSAVLIGKDANGNDVIKILDIIEVIERLKDNESKPNL